MQQTPVIDIYHRGYNMYEHLSDLSNLIEETRNLIQEIALKNMKKMTKSKRGQPVVLYDIDLQHADCPRLVQNLHNLYNDRGMGFKLLASSFGNISYTRLRTLFAKLNIETRKGNDCVTDSLRKIRSERAKKFNPWADWTGNENLKTMHTGKKRYSCGWYFNKSKNKFVWFRSSWEYAYSKILDHQNLTWDVEVRSYLLSDGRYYRPDFFVFEKERLIKVVEVKSKWNDGSLDRVDKFLKFKDEYPDIQSELVTDELFDSLGQSQLAVLDEWKKIRILEKQND